MTLEGLAPLLARVAPEDLQGFARAIGEIHRTYNGRALRLSEQMERNAALLRAVESLCDCAQLEELP